MYVHVSVPLVSRNLTIGMSQFLQLFWREYFVDVLPENAEAVVAVVSNTCNQSFSFSVDGEHITYLGPTDAHDPKYDHLVVRQAVASSLNTRAAPNNRAYTTVGLDDSVCWYTIAVYPSQALEDTFVTNRPIIFTACVALIFLFTSLVFIMYDLLVARRQRIVMTKALQSGAIVNSLFPVSVQARMFDEEGATKQRPATAWHAKESLDVAESETKDEAIADLFPHCTVLFADVAGFTGWRYVPYKTNSEAVLGPWRLETIVTRTNLGNDRSVSVAVPYAHPKTCLHCWKPCLARLTQSL
jgi:hypothetical protein